MPTADQARPTAQRAPHAPSHSLPAPNPSLHHPSGQSHSPNCFAPGTHSNNIHYDVVESARHCLNQNLTDSHNPPSSCSAVASYGVSDTFAAVPRATFKRRDGPSVPGSGRHRYLGQNGKSERCSEAAEPGNAGSSWVLSSTISECCRCFSRNPAKCTSSTRLKITRSTSRENTAPTQLGGPSMTQILTLVRDLRADRDSHMLSAPDRTMDVYSNTFCAGGAVMGNGTWVIFGGNERTSTIRRVPPQC